MSDTNTTRSTDHHVPLAGGFATPGDATPVVLTTTPSEPGKAPEAAQTATSPNSEGNHE